MINAITGRPGGGKSYEAVAFHVIPAIESGRKVVTNLPLNLDHFVKVFGAEVDELIHVVDGKLDDFGSLERPFSKIDDYNDEWRDEQGKAPLYVIDEAHMVLPARSCSPEILEWYSMHRHRGIDILLMTQNLRKIHRDIKDMIEVSYYCAKNTAIGSSKSYTRKVKNGANGEVVSQSVRTYKKGFFPFYQSHTASNKAVEEAMASDITPIWKKWYVWLSILMIIGGLYFVLSNGFLGHVSKPEPTTINQGETISTSVSEQLPPTPPKQPFGVLEQFELFGAGQIRQVTFYREANNNKLKINNQLTFDKVMIDVYLDRKLLFTTNNFELERLGYGFEILAECFYLVTWEGTENMVTCGEIKEDQQEADVTELNPTPIL
ncbi:zonular occludens toxin domain-containing protein [Vibrio hannami]|uniref:zonular occludens toxin domain-containing protein n=2 Tax=Vibrio hannami TaxID=2717094 RepID=UPI003EB755B1